MCEHHHAAKHILCSQCDMLVALPRLEHGQKAACPRCGTTLTVAWDAPRQRPTAYALAALFMLLLSTEPTTAFVPELVRCKMLTGRIQIFPLSHSVHITAKGQTRLKW